MIFLLSSLWEPGWAPGGKTHKYLGGPAVDNWVPPEFLISQTCPDWANKNFSLFFSPTHFFFYLRNPNSCKSHLYLRCRIKITFGCRCGNRWPGSLYPQWYGWTAKAPNHYPWYPLAISLFLCLPSLIFIFATLHCDTLFCGKGKQVSYSPISCRVSSCVLDNCPAMQKLYKMERIIALPFPLQQLSSPQFL